MLDDDKTPCPPRHGNFTRGQNRSLIYNVRQLKKKKEGRGKRKRRRKKNKKRKVSSRKGRKLNKASARIRADTPD